MESATAPKGCTNLKLRQLGRLVTQHYDGFMAATGMKNSQYSLLSYVVRLGPMQPSQLAEQLRMDTSTLSRNLRPLVDRGWVVLEAGADARSRVVRATAAGEAQRQSAQKVWKQAQVALNARLGAERVATLHAVLDDCLIQLNEPHEVANA